MEALLLALALFVAPPAPCVNAECYCESCACTDCSCLRAVCDGPAKCECVGCRSKTVNPTPPLTTFDQSPPLELVLVTAEEWCIPCQQLAPHWKAATETDPICRTLDVSDPDSDAAEEAKAYGVNGIPSLVRLVDGKPDKVSQVGGIDSTEAMQDVVRRWKSEVAATFAEGVREKRKPYRRPK